MSTGVEHLSLLASLAGSILSLIPAAVVILLALRLSAQLKRINDNVDMMLILMRASTLPKEPLSRDRTID